MWAEVTHIGTLVTSFTTTSTASSSSTTSVTGSHNKIWKSGFLKFYKGTSLGFESRYLLNLIVWKLLNVTIFYLEIIATESRRRALGRTLISTITRL
jgi:hypothetical protein